MRKLLVNIIFVLLLVITIALGGLFSSALNKEKIKQTRVVIFPVDKNFIEPDEVKKMIDIGDSLTGKIDIQKIENKLKKNRFVAKAEVYKDLNANIYAYIEQFEPLARVVGNTSYYIDTEGKKRPLSVHYTENVPLVFGNPSKQQQKDIYQLLRQINKDQYLKDNLTEIHIDASGKYKFRASGFKPDIIFGKYEDIAEKLSKLKGILMYLSQKKIKDKYNSLDLQFKNQIVCKK